ncbi:MAG: NfeD family protein [Cyanobacteria bacterium P01_F01_bin.86]
MNLLRALFKQELEDTAFFKETYPLTDDFLRNGETLAVVRSAIKPGELGHVKFHGVRWRASCDRPEAIAAGTQVRVLGRRANILVVEPIEVVESTGDQLFPQPYEGTLNTMTAW